MDPKLRKELFRVVKESDGRFHAYHRITGRVIIVCPTRQDAESALDTIYPVGNPQDWTRADLGRGWYPSWLHLAREVRNAWIVSNGDTPPGRAGKRVAGYG